MKSSLEEPTHHSSPACGCGGSIVQWGCFWVAGTQRLVKVVRRIRSTKTSLTKTWSKALKISDWNDGSPSKWTMTPNQTSKTMQQRLRENSVNVVEGPSQRPNLNPIKHHRRDPKTSVLCLIHWSESNLTELQRICGEEWQKISKSRCAELGLWYARGLEAQSAAKGAATLYWVKVQLNYGNVVFQFFQSISTQSLWFIRLWHEGEWV